MTTLPSEDDGILYRVRQPLWHDGVAYAPGADIPAAHLSEAQIAHLTGCGTLVMLPPAAIPPVVAPSGEDVSPPPSPEPPPPADDEPSAAKRQRR